MILAVTGGRNYSNRTRVDEVLSKYISPRDRESAIIHGGARGADLLAAVWAEHNGIHTVVVAPMWSAWGMAAGPFRNRIMAMLDPELLIAFPGGRGTASMISMAIGYSIRIVEVKE